MIDTVNICHYESPVGELILGAYGDTLCLCDWMNEKRRVVIDRRICSLLNVSFEYGFTEVTMLAIRELDEYFNRKRCNFDIPLTFAGTSFQKMVWNRMLSIPYGSTITYSEMSAELGIAGSVRAVASAIGANAISIFAPCHRIIGVNNKLVGYAGGIPAKQYLLSLESAISR